MYVERTRLRPYQLPDLALPAQADWREILDRTSNAKPPLRTAVSVAIARLVSEQARAGAHLENSLVSPGTFSAMLTSFAEAASNIASIASGSEGSSQSTGAPSISLLFEAHERRAANQAIYDQFFRVTREQGLDRGGFAASILSSYARALFDFPYTSISRTEMLVMLRSMIRSLEIIAGEKTSDETALTMLPFIPGDRNTSFAQALSDAWEASDGDPDWQTHVADHRWISGHHLFFLFANFCRISRDRAVIAVRRGNHGEAAARLYDAAMFQRALASAMWYAGDFPPALYRSHTRSWMSSAGAANGFSGSDNVDYADLHTSRKVLTDALFVAFGNVAEEWPLEIEQAFRALHEAEVQHAEQHVMIAARMVGTDTSLVQKRMTRAVFSAVDVLRDMVAEEWTDLSNRFA